MDAGHRRNMLVTLAPEPMIGFKPPSTCVISWRAVCISLSIVESYVAVEGLSSSGTQLRKEAIVMRSKVRKSSRHPKSARARHTILT